MDDRDLEAQIAHQDEIVRRCMLCEENAATRKRAENVPQMYLHTCMYCGSYWASHARELQIGLMQPTAKRNLRDFVRAKNAQNEYPDLGDILVEYWRLVDTAGDGGLPWLRPGVSYPAREELKQLPAGDVLGMRLFRSLNVYDSPEPDDSIWLSLNSGRVRMAAPNEVPADAFHSRPSRWPLDRSRTESASKDDKP